MACHFLYRFEVCSTRWAASAVRTYTGWQVTSPRPVPNPPAFVDALYAATSPVLAGFDFPIGVPAAYGGLTGLTTFLAALEVFGYGEWAEFFVVAEMPQQISLRRPLYPYRATATANQSHLVNGLGIDTFDALRRQCERATAIRRRAACPLVLDARG
jgi:hypothetical protein